MNQTARVSPSGQSRRMSAPPTNSTTATPEMMVSRSNAPNWACWSV